VELLGSIACLYPISVIAGYALLDALLPVLVMNDHVSPRGLSIRFNGLSARGPRSVSAWSSLGRQRNVIEGETP
jgi:hypothetical protein